MGSNIIVDVNYKYKNPVTNEINIHTMHAAVTLVPEIEAEYIGGYEQLRKYLKEKCIKKISELIPKQFQQGSVRFTVNEKGEIVNAEISMSSGDKAADKLLLDAINKMPKWKPAENSKGIKVKQQFQFSMGNGNDGC